MEQLNGIIGSIHDSLSGGREKLVISYEPDISAEDFENRLRAGQERDIRLKQTTVGPHRDDFAFIANDIDIRRFGSQGQQRTAALSLKLSEIELVKKNDKRYPHTASGRCPVRTGQQPPELSSEQHRGYSDDHYLHRSG